MRFTKMQGVGNDFVVVQSDAIPAGTDLPGLAVRLCARHFGVGADGLLVVSQTANSDTAFSMRMFNPDGTEDMCGNGLRCVSLYAHTHGWLRDQANFTVATKEGPRKARLLEVGENGRSAVFGVDMGVPSFRAADIPFAAPEHTPIINYPLAVEDRDFSITSVNTGSTHTIIFGAPIDDFTFKYYSPLIENHPLFPERTSIMWAAQTGPNAFDIRIWERGAGETLGCGTGACAVGVAAQMLGLTAPGAAVLAASRGGVLRITWDGNGSSIDMVGPAAQVFEGEIAVG